VSRTPSVEQSIRTGLFAGRGGFALRKQLVDPDIMVRSAEGGAEASEELRFERPRKGARAPSAPRRLPRLIGLANGEQRQRVGGMPSGGKRRCT
jgi:hypothetical protein